MIFKVNAEIDIRKTNEDIDAVPEFVECNDKSLKYIFLMHDYDSPYARLPKDIRKEQVLVAIGYTNKNTIITFFQRHGKKIEKASKAFRKMQYNSDFEALISLKIQIKQWNDLLRKDDKSEKELTLAQKIFDKMPSYIKRVKELEEIVGYRDVVEDDDDNQMSTLEEYMESYHNRLDD